MTARQDFEALIRKEFEAWAIEEGYAERNRYGLWFTNSVHEHSLWMGYQAADKAATERAAALAPGLATDLAIKYAGGWPVDFETIAAAIRAQTGGKES